MSRFVALVASLSLLVGCAVAPDRRDWVPMADGGPSPQGSTVVGTWPGFPAAPTLDAVTDQGATTSNAVTVGAVNVGGAASAATGQITWPTGLGAVTHLEGPSDQALRIDGNAAAGINLSNLWSLPSSTGHWLPVAANARDIGTSGIPIRTLYAGTNVQTPQVTLGSGGPAITAASSGVIFKSALFNRIGDSNFAASVSNGVFTNRDVSGTATETYAGAQNSTATGARITLVRVASHAYRFSPGNASNFTNADGTTTTTGKYKELGSDGALLELVYDGANTTWIVLRERGTVTDEP